MILLVGLLLVVALRWFSGFGFDGGFFRLFVLILFSFGLGLVGCFGFGCCVVTPWVLV